MSSHKAYRQPDSHALGRGITPLNLTIAAVFAMGLAYAVVLAQPGFVHALRGVLGHSPLAARTPWALPAVAAGIAVAGAAIGVLVLSAVARLAQRNPYLWLGPVLVAFTMIVLAGVQAALPWPTLPLYAYAALSGIAMLGGGAVLQMPGRLSKVSGGLLVALPLLSLSAGYAAMPGGLVSAFTASGRGSALVVLIMGLTACGIALTALLSRAEDLEGLARLRAAYEQQRAQLQEAVQHGRLSEVRLQDAERRNELLQHGIVPPSSMSDEAVLQSMRPSAGGTLPWVLGAVALLASAAAAVVYLGLYRPAQTRLRVQHEKLAQVDQAQATALAALRADLDEERAGVVAELEAERAKNVEAQRLAEAAEAKLAAAEPAAAEPAPKAEPKKAPVARAPKRKPARKAKPAPEASAAAGAPVLDRKTTRALNSEDNDPIGGL